MRGGIGRPLTVLLAACALAAGTSCAHRSQSPEGPGPREVTRTTRGDSLPPSGDHVYVEELPEAIEKPEPVYPEAARRAGIRGVVHVQAHVQTDGSVGEVRVIRSIPELDQAAIECAKKWRFKPALGAGRPIAVWTGIPIRFKP